MMLLKSMVIGALLTLPQSGFVQQSSAPKFASLQMKTDYIFYYITGI